MALRDRGKPGVFAVRDVGTLVTETHESGHELKRAVSATQLTAMGVGAIIGTGIFVVIGEGAGRAGPAVILSFVLAAVACTFSALSYAELASSIPGSGSAYTYSYATLGELIAWIIGWGPIPGYGLAVANFSTRNFTPFTPHGTGSVTSAAAIIFFAYIGFDAVSTGSEEARNPKKDLPFAIIGSLVVCTIFYILTAVGALGIATPA